MASERCAPGRTRLCVAALAVLAVVLGGCSTRSAEPDTPEGAAPTSASATDGQEQEPGAQDGADATTQPVVLVTHATAPPRSLTLRGARAVLRGELSAWRVLAAPRMPVAPVVTTLESARAVIRAVERDRWTIGVVPAAKVTPTVRAVRVAGVDPLRTPTAYPVRTDGPEPPTPTRLTVVGDLMLTRGVTDPAGALRPMSPPLRAADLTVGNLESTLSTAGVAQQGGDSFGADPSVLGSLRRAGFDALSLANNHTGDYQEAALVETVRRVRGSPIEPFGAGRDLTQASRPAVLERNGLRFGFIGFNAIGETPAAGARSPGALSVRMPPRTGPLDAGDLRHVTGVVRRLAERVDVVVVLPHWGTQYTHVPEPVQRLVGRRLVDAGADLVAGGHPHWVQGIDAYRGAVVAHSLGNFVFDMDFMTETMQGVVLEATFWGARLKAVGLVPYRMDAAFAPRPAARAEGSAILRDVWATSTGPFRAR